MKSGFYFKLYKFQYKQLVEIYRTSKILFIRLDYRSPFAMTESKKNGVLLNRIQMEERHGDLQLVGLTVHFFSGRRQLFRG